MNKNRIYIVFLLSIYGCLCFSQNPEQNLKKYWYYKYRSDNYFLVKGNCYGCSLPGSDRNSEGSDDPNHPGQLLKDRFGFGDAPDNLGYYIGTLATEYRLLIDNGQITEANQTLQDLYYAMNQINYADACESKRPWFQSSDKIDGFCMRDFGDKEFLLSHLQNGDPNYPSGGTPGPITIIDINDINDNETFDECKALGMSMDHHTYLLSGLALVVKLIPAGATNNGQLFLDNKTADLNLEARLIAARFWSFWYRNNWRIRFPNGVLMPLAKMDEHCGITTNQTLNIDYPKFNQWGQWAGFYSYGFTQAVEKVVGGNIVSFILQKYGNNSSDIGISAADINYDIAGSKPFEDIHLGIPNTTFSDFINSFFSQDFLQQATANFFYTLTAKEIYYLLLTNATSVSEITHAVMLNMECVANIFYEEASSIIATYAAISTAIGGPVIGIAGAIATVPAIESAIYNMSHSYDWDPYYTTLHKILHPNSVVIRSTNSRIEDFLDGAPCSGPYNYGPGNVAPNGWANKRRWSATNAEQYTGFSDDDSWKRALYPGYDYMEMFNLYCLKNNNYIDNYISFLYGNLNISGTIPYVVVDGNAIGNSINILGVDSYDPLIPNPLMDINGYPLNIRTFGSITSDATILAHKAFDEDISAPLFNSTYSGFTGNIVNFIIDAINNTFSNYTTITIHLTTPSLQSNVEFKATSGITLLPGFHAEYGSKFHAVNTAPHCNSSGTGYEKIASGGENGSNENSSVSRKVATNITADNKEEKSDQNTETNNVISVPSIPKEFNILPNPNNGQFTLLLPAKQGLVSRLKIINMMGETVYEITTTNNKVDVSLEYLSSGVYTISHTTESGVQTRKMVVH